MTSVRQPEAHHGLAAHEVVLLLETDPHRGLAEAEACSRRERYGPNALPPARRAGPLARVGHQVNDPLIYVLLAAGAVTVALGEHVDAAVIFGVVALNTLIGYVQESRAQSALDALRALTRTQVTVVRDGRARRQAYTAVRNWPARYLNLSARSAGTWSGRPGCGRMSPR